MTDFMKSAIQTLRQGKTLSKQQTRECLQIILSPFPDSDIPRISAFLALLDPSSSSLLSPDLLAESAAVLREHALPIQHTCAPKHILMDIVGTGGDGLDTFNVSTATALVLSCIPSIRVLKHGNRASSSKCGSADLLQALGAEIDISGEQAVQVLDSVGFCFLFANRLHPSLARLAPLRRGLSVRTLFNVLGPLINPACPSVQVSGVCSLHLGPLYAQTFAQMGISGVVLHGENGLDEMSICGNTFAWFVGKDGEITEQTLHPHQFGLECHGIQEIAGSGPSENAQQFIRVLQGEKGPVRDFLLLNVSTALYAAGQVDSFQKGVQVGRDLIDSGDVFRQLQKYIMVSQQVSEGNQSILTRIFEQRRKDVEAKKSMCSMASMFEKLVCNPPPMQMSGFTVPDLHRGVHQMAEIKRASPSKGVINGSVDVEKQTLLYAAAGVLVISVLTEPNWFKGSLEDLSLVRHTLQDIPNRPLVLLKDFVLDEYQLLEARRHGADLVLLIVKMLTPDRLCSLFNFARRIGLELLVEVNSLRELQTALEIGAKVIGVNNRNLETFEVDLSTTFQVLSALPTDSDVFVVALSGVFTRTDVSYLEESGAHAFLVGEALMRSPSPVRLSRELCATHAPLVKICGLCLPSDALAAAEMGADFVGVIFAESLRKVSGEQAAEIVRAVRGVYTKNEVEVVGVFRNQSVEYINKLVRDTGLDLVQLHGDEDDEFVSLISCPVIKVLGVHWNSTADSIVAEATRFPHASHFLLDTCFKGVSGGLGQTFDWSILKVVSTQLSDRPLFVAGGLCPENVGLLSKYNIHGVDVCSGVEQSPRVKDLVLIAQFMRNMNLSTRKVR